MFEKAPLFGSPKRGLEKLRESGPKLKRTRDVSIVSVSDSTSDVSESAPSKRRSMAGVLDFMVDEPDPALPGGGSHEKESDESYNVMKKMKEDESLETLIETSPIVPEQPAEEKTLPVASDEQSNVSAPVRRRSVGKMSRTPSMEKIASAVEEQAAPKTSSPSSVRSKSSGRINLVSSLSAAFAEVRQSKQRLSSYEAGLRDISASFSSKAADSEARTENPSTPTPLSAQLLEAALPNVSAIKAMEVRVLGKQRVWGWGLLSVVVFLVSSLGLYGSFDERLVSKASALFKKSSRSSQFVPEYEEVLLANKLEDASPSQNKVDSQSTVHFAPEATKSVSNYVNEKKGKSEATKSDKVKRSPLKDSSPSKSKPQQDEAKIPQKTAEHHAEEKKNVEGIKGDGAASSLPNHVEASSPSSIDYAVAQRGGRVVVRDSSLSSQPLTSPAYATSLSPLELIRHVASPLKVESDPSIVISSEIKASSKAALKQCFCFQGAEGSITISLGRAVPLNAVQVMHLQQAESHKAYRGSAPSHFSVQGFDAEGAAIDLGSFAYEAASSGFDEVQTFPVKNTQTAVRALTFSFASNHGAPFTCVYRLKAIGGASETEI